MRNYNKISYELPETFENNLIHSEQAINVSNLIKFILRHWRL
jgi:hypothetical protein